MLEWAAFFLGPHDPVTQFQTIPVACGRSCLFRLLVDASGV